MLSLNRVETFLYAEAQCADEHRFDEWLALWDAEDILYWVPAGTDDIEPDRHVSIVYDDKPEALKERVLRLKSRGVHAQQPRSRLRRLLSNVTVDGDDGATAMVYANFMLVAHRRNVQDVFAGRILYNLRYDDQHIRLKSKKVMLLNNDECLGNLTFLV